MSKKKSGSHLGAWLKVDENNKRVEYQVDPKWLKNASDKEQEAEMAKLTSLASIYQRAGYAVIDFVKKIF